MTYVLDTDVLEHFQRGNANVHQRVAAAGITNCVISIATRVEVLQARFEYLRKSANALQLKTAQHWLNESDRLLSEWLIVPFDDSACREFDRLRTMKPLRKMGRIDLLIACITLANHATLVTRNVRDFLAVPGLPVENWVD